MSPRVAVLTLTRDRLDYTRHCFQTLRDNAGCDFHHYVLDQGSTDGTADWLEEQDCETLWLTENIGISLGHNLLLDHIGPSYDVYVTFDNDCEVTMLGTLAAAARVAADGGWIVSPQVRGLINTPTPGEPVYVAGEPVGPFPAIGGIFRAMPAAFANTFRFNTGNPTWGGDENDVGRAAAARGIGVGYLLNWHVNHYRTTEQQNADFPDYHQRKILEMA